MLARRIQTSQRPFLFSDRVLDDLFGTFAHPERPELSVQERLDEDESSFRIDIELPGVREEELEVQVQENRVIVAVKGSDERGHETRFNTFQRTFRFRTALNAEAATASLDHGILTIQLPKAASAVPRTLTITTHQ